MKKKNSSQNKDLAILQDKSIKYTYKFVLLISQMSEGKYSMRW